MGVLKAIKTSLVEMEKRKWEKMYYYFDIHSTILKPNYTLDSMPDEFYPFAKEALIEISSKPYITMGLYTCSHPDEVEKYLKFFKDLGINFSYANVNPEVPSAGYGYYETKPYMNVLFEDKSGFDAEEEWKGVLDFVKESMP